MFHPVRKPQHIYWGLWKYLQKQSISFLFLPAGRQGGQGQSPPLSNGVHSIDKIRFPST
jgi:hypothetical protein